MPEPQLTCEQERLLANYVVGKREYNAARGKPSRWVPFPAQGCDAITAALEELRALRAEVAVMRRIFADGCEIEGSDAIRLARAEGKRDAIEAIDAMLKQAGYELVEQANGWELVYIHPQLGNLTLHAAHGSLDST